LRSSITVTQKKSHTYLISPLRVHILSV